MNMYEPKTQTNEPKTEIGRFNKAKREGLKTQMEEVRFILDHYKMSTLMTFTGIDHLYLKALKEGTLDIAKISLKSYNELLALYFTQELDFPDDKDKNYVGKSLEDKKHNQKLLEDKSHIDKVVDETKKIYDEAVKKAQKELFESDTMLENMTISDLKHIIYKNKWYSEFDSDSINDRSRLLLFLYNKLGDKAKEIMEKEKKSNVSEDKSSDEPFVKIYNKEYDSLDEIFKDIFGEGFFKFK